MPTSRIAIGPVCPAAIAAALAFNICVAGGADAQTVSSKAPKSTSNPYLAQPDLRGSSADFDAAMAAVQNSDLTAIVPPVTDPPSNKGKPRTRPDPRLKYSGLRKVPNHALPALVPYPTAPGQRQRTTRTGGPEPQPPTTIATVPPIPRKPHPKLESDPYAPLGIGIGSLRLVPYIEQDVGYDSNTQRSSTSPIGSMVSRTEAGFDLKSDWSVHQLTGSVKGGYNYYRSDPNSNRPDGQAKFDLRVDATRDTNFDAEVRGTLDTQRPGSPELNATVKGRPLVATYGATGGVNQAIGDLQLGLHGTFDRTAYENGRLSSGNVVVLSGNDYNAWGTQVRAGYQITPGVTPFVEASADLRRHDQKIDSLGFARDSDGLAGKIGSTFELSRLLTGQVAVGYAQRTYADSRLPTLAAPTIDASLVWTASPLSTVTLRAVSTLNETTVANASGAVSRTVSVEIAHALLRNLSIGAIGSLGVNDYKGISLHETTYSGTLKVDYNLTRSVVVRGSFTHERLSSSAAGSDYTANVFLLGLKLQR